MRRFRIERAPADDTQWLAGVLDREGERFGTSVEVTEDGRLRLVW
jgi:poly-gamma-glutamate synthesis protein (capsule biosynthesis protein)